MTKIQMFETTAGDLRRGNAVVLVIVDWKSKANHKLQITKSKQ